MISFTLYRLDTTINVSCKSYNLLIVSYMFRLLTAIIRLIQKDLSDNSDNTLPANVPLGKIPSRTTNRDIPAIRRSTRLQHTTRTAGNTDTRSPTYSNRSKYEFVITTKYYET